MWLIGDQQAFGKSFLERRLMDHGENVVVALDSLRKLNVLAVEPISAAVSQHVPHNI